MGVVERDVRGSGPKDEMMVIDHDADNSSADRESQVIGTVEGLQSGLKSRHAQMIALGKIKQ